MALPLSPFQREQFKSQFILFVVPNHARRGRANAKARLPGAPRIDDYHFARAHKSRDVSVAMNDNARLMLGKTRGQGIGIVKSRLVKVAVQKRRAAKGKILYDQQRKPGPWRINVSGHGVDRRERAEHRENVIAINIARVKDRIHSHKPFENAGMKPPMRVRNQAVAMNGHQKFSGKMGGRRGFHEGAND